MARRIELPGSDELFGEDGRAIPAPAGRGPSSTTPARRRRRAAPAAARPVAEAEDATRALLDAQAQVESVAIEIREVRSAVDAAVDQVAEQAAGMVDADGRDRAPSRRAGAARATGTGRGGRRPGAESPAARAGTPTRSRGARTPGRAEGRRTAAPGRPAVADGARGRTDARPARASSGSRPRRSEGDVMARVERVEAALPDLPIDALVDLRDGIESLLASDTLDADAVVRLLARVEA